MDGKFGATGQQEKAARQVENLVSLSRFQKVIPTAARFLDECFPTLRKNFYSLS